jgi:hypothetical protein
MRECKISLGLPNLEPPKFFDKVIDSFVKFRTTNNVNEVLYEKIKIKTSNKYYYYKVIDELLPLKP